MQVSEDADESVISAAYRALSKRYHPDVAKTGDAAMMSAINEAYETLSNPKLRSQYDSKRDRADDLQDDLRKPSESDEDIKLWGLKCELYPEIKAEFESLAGISQTLANTFKLSLVEASDLERHAQIATALRRGYLTRYFGNATRLHEAGEALIRRGEREKAKELNHIVSALGAKLSDDQADRILRKVGLTSTSPHRPQQSRQDQPVPNEERSWWLLVAIVGLICIFWLLGASRR